MSSGDRSLQTLWATQRIADLNHFVFYVNPSIQKIDDVINCDQMVRVGNLKYTLEIPDIFSTMFQFGYEPNGKGKRIRMEAEIFDVEVNFHEIQMPSKTLLDCNYLL